MPLLEKMTRLEKEAEDFGFKWENANQIMAQIRSECDEIEVHLNDPASDSEKIKLQEEIGDLLHAVFSLCLFCQLSPKATFEKTLTKFERRLDAVKLIAKEQGLTSLEGRPFDELMDYWQKAKKRV